MADTFHLKPFILKFLEIFSEQQCIYNNDGTLQQCIYVDTALFENMLSNFIYNSNTIQFFFFFFFFILFFFFFGSAMTEVPCSNGWMSQLWCKYHICGFRLGQPIGRL